MARINIDDDFIERLSILAGKFGCRVTAAGQMLLFLVVAQNRFKHGRPVTTADFAVNGFSDKLIPEWAVIVDGGFMYWNAESEFGWLKKRAESGRKGGLKSGEVRRSESNELAEANGSKAKQLEPSSSSSSSEGSKEPSIDPGDSVRQETAEQPPLLDEPHPLDWLVDLWNELRGPMPSVFRISKGTARHRHVMARLKAHPEPSVWRHIFTRMEQSEFVSGRDGKWAGGGFDWVMESEGNVDKVLNGNYNPKERQVTQTNWEEQAKFFVTGMKRFSPHSSKDRDAFQEYLGDLAPVVRQIEGGTNRIRSMREDEFFIRKVAALLKDASTKLKELTK